MEIIEATSTNKMELRVVYNLTHNLIFMEEFCDKLPRHSFDNKYYEKVARLCISYYKKFNKVPDDTLSKYFDNAVTLKKISPNDAAEMSIVISSLQNESPSTDIEFEISDTYNYFKTKTLTLATDEAKSLIDEGKVDEAKELLDSFEVLQQAKVEGEDIYSYTEADYEKIFNETSEQIVKLPYALGNLMNDVLVRNGFVTFMGRPKAGKSWWLMYMARMARNQGKRVIFISAGDMTRSQTIKRMLQGDARTSTSSYYLDKQYLPCFDCLKNQKGTCFNRKGDGNLLNEWNELDEMPVIKDDIYQPCCDLGCPEYKDIKNQVVSYRKVNNPLLDATLAMKLQQKWHDNNNEGVLHVEHAPSGTLTKANRRTLIQAVCKKYGWDNPDMIVIDYANILAYEGKDERDSIHKIWQSLRADADIFKCLVLTATHSNSSAFDFEDLSLRSFALDRRIFDEVSGCIAINQKPDERRKGIWRLTALLKREGEFDEAIQAECYGNLAMGSPHFISQKIFRDPPKPKNN